MRDGSGSVIGIEAELFLVNEGEGAAASAVSRLVTSACAAGDLAVPFSGKGRGWFVIPRDGCPPYLKLAADALYGEEVRSVVEVSTPEAVGWTSALLLEDSLRWLVTNARTLGLRFLMGSTGVGRCAYQVSINLRDGRDEKPFCEAISPLLATATTTFRVGGLTYGGYFPAPRLQQHVRSWQGSEETLSGAPILYRKLSRTNGWTERGPTARVHISLENLRAAPATALQAALLSLVAEAWQREPTAFDLSLVDTTPLIVAQQMNTWSESLVRVRVGRAVRRWTAAQIVGYHLCRIGDVLEPSGADARWLKTMVALLENLRNGRQGGVLSIFNDFELRRGLIEQCLTESGLRLGTEECDRCLGVLSRLQAIEPDLDGFFSRRRPRFPDLLLRIEERCNEVPVTELRRRYASGLRALLLWEGSFRLLGGEGTCDALIQVHGGAGWRDWFRPAGEDRVSMAPRAHARLQLMTTQPGVVSAAWDKVETRTRVFRLGGPEEDLFTMEQTLHGGTT
jgi:hypothetical protein